VFGFEDVFARAMHIRLPGHGYRIRIPSPAGYGVLKTRAWADRSKVP
jgi:predicted nucleotidyltransferase